MLRMQELKWGEKKKIAEIRKGKNDQTAGIRNECLGDLRKGS